MADKIQLNPEFTTVSDSSFFVRTVIWLVMIIVGMMLSLSETHTYSFLGIILLGLGIAHGVELSHQALHNTGFSSSSLNTFFGILMGLPLLVSFHEYRISHLAHHAKVGTKEDTEYFDYGDGRLSLPTIFSTLTMWKHYLKYVRNLLTVLTGGSVSGFRKKHQTKLKLFYVYSLLMVSILLLVGGMIGEITGPVSAWLLAMLLVATPVHALIEFPEHYKCDGDSRDILRNTRSITSNRFLSWFTNYNNFHVEHHMYPAVPLQKAPRVFALLHPQHRHYKTTYLEFYSAVITGRI